MFALLGVDHGGIQPPVGPTPRPDVHPLPLGTHLLFTQSGRIEHVPLDGHSMKKDDAKAVLHLPVCLFKIQSEKTKYSILCNIFFVSNRVYFISFSI